MKKNWGTSYLILKKEMSIVMNKKKIKKIEELSEETEKKKGK
jgi:hypothetical protein